MAALRTYWKKRDFGKTAEPRGKTGRKKGFGYVIQKHDATRLHYDLRLELDGVMLSWAVTRGPSLVPGEKRLAIHVEDHPIEYNKFEGTIPKGQYGGGTVQLWDNGTWEPHSDEPLKDLAKGRLTFTLDGERLHGGWALIRMRDWNAKTGKKSSRHNWLLIKENDDVAAPGDPDALLAIDTSVKTGRTLDEIAGDKRGKVWKSNREEKAPRSAAKVAAPVKKKTPRPRVKSRKK